jgi:hypothetical protein
MALSVNELYNQMEKFKRLSEDDDPLNKERFTKLYNVYTQKWKDAVAQDIADREARLEQRIIERVGDFEVWMDWAKSLYAITYDAGLYEVKSKARDWKDDRVWKFEHNIDCLEKIEQLIGYKIYDRKRGRGDMGEDVQ